MDTAVGILSCGGAVQPFLNRRRVWVPVFAFRETGMTAEFVG